MKRIVLIFLVFITISCTKDKLEDASLEGEWILTNVSCFCYFGEDYDFTSNSLTFNSKENEITVENNEEFTFLMESGTYNYLGKDDQISFDDNRSYIFSIEGSTLSLSYVDDPSLADDEISYTYRKK